MQLLLYARKLIPLRDWDWDGLIAISQNATFLILKCISIWFNESDAVYGSDFVFCLYPDFSPADKFEGALRNTNRKVEQLILNSPRNDCSKMIRYQQLLYDSKLE